MSIKYNETSLRNHYSKIHHSSKYLFRAYIFFLTYWANWLNCLLLSFLLSFSFPVHAEDRALIVGINAYQFLKPLKGSVTDAKSVLQLLQKLNVYQTHQIRLLTDSQATRQNILEGLEWLMRGSQPGDNILFYFSGHGAQVLDFNHDEADGLDETLCPVETDLTRGAMITDDEINERLTRLNGRKLLVLIDSCHSGTISKGTLPKGIQLKTPLFTQSLPETKAITHESLVNSSIQGETIIYSAVASNQFAIDTPDGGVFTSALINIIEERKGRISHQKILDAVRQVSKEVCQQYQSICHFGLTPQLEVSSNFLRDRSIFLINPSPLFPSPKLLSLEILPTKMLHVGQSMKFKINSQESGYLIIFDIDSNGAVTCIFPDKNSGKNIGYIKTGETLMIPDTHDNFGFKIGEPLGKGMTIVVLAGNESLAKQIIALSENSSFNKGIERVFKNKVQEIANQIEKKLVEILKQDKVVVLNDYEIIR